MKEVEVEWIRFDLVVRCVGCVQLLFDLRVQGPCVDGMSSEEAIISKP